MAHRIDNTFLLTASNADVLSGSSLDPMPRPGYLRVYAADIVSTGTIEVDPANHPSPTGSGPQVIPEAGSGDSAANHPVIAQFMPHWETEVDGGEKVVIRLAGTISECAVWVTLSAA